jgi:hypothetical protein
MELISSYKIFDPTNIKCQNGQVLLPGQVFNFNGQALIAYIICIWQLVDCGNTVSAWL